MSQEEEIFAEKKKSKPGFAQNPSFYWGLRWPQQSILTFLRHTVCHRMCWVINPRGDLLVRRLDLLHSLCCARAAPFPVVLEKPRQSLHFLSLAESTRCDSLPFTWNISTCLPSHATATPNNSGFI